MRKLLQTGLYLAELAENSLTIQIQQLSPNKGRDLLPGTNDTYSWLGSKDRKLITVIDRPELS